MTHVHFVVLVREPNRKTVFADGIAKQIECGINRAANAIWHYCRKKQAKQSQASLSPDEQFIRRNQCIVANAECFRTTMRVTFKWKSATITKSAGYHNDRRSDQNL